MSFLGELKRRHVGRAALAYLAGAWLLIQVLETLFPIFGLPETSVRVVVVVLAIGFVPAVVIAWLFEWTAAGLVRDTDAPRSPARTPGPRRGDRVVIGLLTLAVVYFAADRYLFSESADLTRVERIAVDDATRHPADDVSVAVLPFAGDGDERRLHFAAGLTDAIRVSLAGVDDLRVTARQSAEPYGNSRHSIREIGRILNVQALLTGNVQRSAERIRVTAELLDAESESVLWAHVFDAMPAVEDVLDIQDRIAATVAGALQLEFRAGTAGGATEPRSLAALDAYHDGLYDLEAMIQTRGFEDEERVERAGDAFERAINADPGWALPRAMLGRLYHFRWNVTAEPGDLAASKRHIDDALRLDPGLAPALSAHAYLLSVEGEYDAALQEYERAVARGSTDAWWGLGLLYGTLGRQVEAVAALRRAVSSDPLVLALREQLAEAYYCAGEYREALDDFEKYFPLEPDTATVDRIRRADLYARTGNLDEAMRIAADIATEYDGDALIAAILVKAGLIERARAALAGTGETAPFVVLDIVPGAILLGEEDRALDMLEAAAATATATLRGPGRNGWIRKLQCSPEIRSLAGHPRYEALLESLGLPR